MIFTHDFVTRENHCQIASLVTKSVPGNTYIILYAFAQCLKDTGEIDRYRTITKTHTKKGNGMHGLWCKVYYFYHQFFLMAKKELSGSTMECCDFEQFCVALDKQKLLLSPFCGEITCKEKITKLTTSAHTPICCMHHRQNREACMSSCYFLII